MSGATFESLTDALNDIIKKTKGSRTVTRRLMWIEGRAQSALEGKDWARQVFMMPDPRNSAPKAERLGKEVATLRYELGEAERKLGERDALLREITEDPRLVVAMKSAHLSAIRLLLSASAEPASPKCTTCSDVGVIGHSTMCPDCEPAKGGDGETSK